MWTSCANQIDNSDEQKDTALFICVLTDVFNKYFLKGKMNTHTYLSPLDICAFRNTFFSSLTRFIYLVLSNSLLHCQVSVPFSVKTPDYFRQSSVSIPWVPTTPFTPVSQQLLVHFVSLVSPPDCEHLRGKDTSSSSLNPQETDNRVA